MALNLTVMPKQRTSTAKPSKPKQMTASAKPLKPYQQKNRYQKVFQQPLPLGHRRFICIRSPSDCLLV